MVFRISAGRLCRVLYALLNPGYWLWKMPFGAGVAWRFCTDKSCSVQVWLPHILRVWTWKLEPRNK